MLHSCCAPCSSYCIEYLRQHFDLTVFYYNPNIMPVDEYKHRLAEQIRLCSEWKINVIEGEYDSDNFISIVRGMENLPEGGARCAVCFDMRLYKTATTAADMGFDYFGTTLTVSPHKNAAVINEIGSKIAEKVGVAFLPADFKKRDGYKRSIVLSQEYGLYRQDYCGCRLGGENDD